MKPPKRMPVLLIENGRYRIEYRAITVQVTLEVVTP